MRRTGTLGASAKGPGSWLVVLSREADDLVNLVAGQVRRRAQVGIAHHVEVGEAGQPKRLAQAAAAGALNVENQVGVVADRTVGRTAVKSVPTIDVLYSAELRKLFVPS